MTFVDIISAWGWYWVVNSCEGCGQSCSGLPQQSGDWNGIFGTGKKHFILFIHRQKVLQVFIFIPLSKSNWSSSSSSYLKSWIGAINENFPTLWITYACLCSFYCSWWFIAPFTSKMLMLFSVQANTDEELPESLLGTCRLNHLDAAKAVLVKPWLIPSHSGNKPAKFILWFNQNWN